VNFEDDMSKLMCVFSFLAIIHVLGAADTDLSDVILCSDDKLYVRVSQRQKSSRYRVRIRSAISKVR